MSMLLIHNMDTAWSSSNPALLQVTSTALLFSSGSTASNQLTADFFASSVFSEYVPVAPVDLQDYEEIRFWIRADHQADGSLKSPFFLEYSYIDAGDLPGEEHRWYVPVNLGNTWEQRRIGIRADRRTAITRFRFRCLVDFPFQCCLDEMLAVQPEMLSDVESSLVSLLSPGLSLPGVTQVPLKQLAASGTSAVALNLNTGFASNNHILLQGGSAGDLVRDVTAVVHDPVADTTTLQLSIPLQGNFPALTARVTLLVPVIVECPPVPAPATAPMILVTFLSVREDDERTAYVQQRDSFRARGGLTVCSLRPPARAYQVDYELTVIAPDRTQQRIIQNLLHQKISADIPLVVNGSPSPVITLPPPALITRQVGLVAPLYFRIGTYLETGIRQEIPWIEHTEIRGAPMDAPSDQEGIVLDF